MSFHENFSTTLPVAEMNFPAITICKQGLDMEAVQRAFWLDYTAWQMKQNTPSKQKREAVNHPDFENFDNDLELDTYLQEMLVKQFGYTQI